MKTYDQAVSLFGSSLPSQGQWEELRSICVWAWTGRGYKVVGPSVDPRVTTERISKETNRIDYENVR